MLKFLIYFFLRLNFFFHYYHFFTLVEICSGTVDLNFSSRSFSSSLVFLSILLYVILRFLRLASAVLSVRSLFFSVPTYPEQKGIRDNSYPFSIYSAPAIAYLVAHLDFPCLVPTTILARMMTTNYNWMCWCTGNVLPRESPQVLKAVGL